MPKPQVDAGEGHKGDASREPSGGSFELILVAVFIAVISAFALIGGLIGSRPFPPL